MRLRELREHEFERLTPADLGRALGGRKNRGVSPATISMWENPMSGRVVPPHRLHAYTQLFCTPRSFEGGVQLIDLADLTDAENDRREELRRELFGLRSSAMSSGKALSPEDSHSESSGKALSPGDSHSVWHFPDGVPITLVSSRLPPELRPPSSNPNSLNYLRFSDLSDLDALFDVYGALRAYNQISRVTVVAAQDLTPRHIYNHLVAIGGGTWEVLTPLLRGMFPIPIKAEDPADRGAIVVRDPDHGELQFLYTLDDGRLVEDVGFFARGKNPAAPRRTLTICGGITTSGVHGAARCFIDQELRERNERYLTSRFPDGSTYSIVMRVPIINGSPITPDLSNEEFRLFEWHQAAGDREE